MNKYLKNLKKIEFVLTNACTGRCKHCSEGNHSTCGESIDPTVASDAVKKIASQYDIKTVMTFGGEPLLCPDAVYAIMSAARELGIEKRQLITNGFFTKDADVIKSVVKGLYDSGVNDLLLSVDAFHQETIPLYIVRAFAEESKKIGIPIRLQPAWLVSNNDDNPYNNKTYDILASVSDLQIEVGEGNIVFPEGNALKYLADYFKDKAPQNPYVENPFDVQCISFSANGDVLNGNIYQKDILQIIEDYNPN